MKKLLAAAVVLFASISAWAVTPSVEVSRVSSSDLFPGHEKDCAHDIRIGGDPKDPQRVPKPGEVPFRLTAPLCVATDSLSGHVSTGVLPTGTVMYAGTDQNGDPIPSSMWVDICGNNVLRVFSKVIRVEPAQTVASVRNNDSRRNDAQAPRDDNWRDSRDSEDRYMTREELLDILDSRQQPAPVQYNRYDLSIPSYLGMTWVDPYSYSYAYPYPYPQSYNFEFSYWGGYRYPRYRDHYRRDDHRHYQPRPSPPSGCGGNCTSNPYPRKPPLPGNGCTNCTTNPYPRHPRH